VISVAAGRAALVGFREGRYHAEIAEITSSWEEADDLPTGGESASPS
jgi:hypothetical protein